METSVVIYHSRHGNTERILREMAGDTRPAIRLVRVEEAGAADIAGAERIAVGGPVYGGRIGKEIVRFCSRNRKELLSKPLALFIGGVSRARFSNQLEMAYPAELREHAEFLTTIGGDIDIDRLPPLTRFLARMITTTEADRHFTCVEGREKLIEFLSGEAAD